METVSTRWAASNAPARLVLCWTGIDVLVSFMFSLLVTTCSLNIITFTAQKLNQERVLLTLLSFCQRLQLSRLSAFSWPLRWGAASIRCWPTSPRRCAAARWAKPGATTANDVLRWAQVSGQRGARHKDIMLGYVIYEHFFLYAYIWMMFDAQWWSCFYSNNKFFLICGSVAFSKICPAGKGYLFQKITESFPFPPFFIPPKPDREGESRNVTHTLLTLNLLLKCWFDLFFFQTQSGR